MKKVFVFKAKTQENKGETDTSTRYISIEHKLYFILLNNNAMIIRLDKERAKNSEGNFRS